MSQSHPGSFAKKKAQKADMAESRANKEKLLALGLNKSMKQAIKGDSLLCMVCKATVMGPLSKCTCKGGVSKPTAEYDSIQDLIAAAKQRFTITQADQKKQAGKDQAAEKKQRDKKKTDKLLNPYGDPNESFTPLPGTIAPTAAYSKNETDKTIKFKVGGLGLTIEGNVLNKEPKKGTQAFKLGVKPGWVMARVNGEFLPLDKAGILAVVKKHSAIATEAEGKEGQLLIEFRMATQYNYVYCGGCNNFKDKNEYMPAQLEEPFGHGKQRCRKCNGDPEDENEDY